VTRPLVSVLVLNFNGEAHLDDCLRTLGEQDYEPIEIVVADNGSRDRSEEIALRYDARWEPLDANHGFAVGNNLGVERCKGDIVVFVNNDMRFAPTFVSELVTPLLHAGEHGALFATDARQRSWDDRSVDHAAMTMVRVPLRRFFRRATALPGLDLVQADVQQRTPIVAPCGSAMAVCKTRFDELGGFDRRMPAGWEDIEIGWRAALLGDQSLFVPQALAWHKVGASSGAGEGGRMRTRGSLMGRVLFATKHLPIEQAAMVWAVAALGLLQAVVRGDRDGARLRGRALADLARLVPALARERRALYRAAATTPRAFLRRQTCQPTVPLVFVLGRRDTPTDGVEDYCRKLVDAFAAGGSPAEIVRVDWMDGGLRGALRDLRRATTLSGTRPRVVLQFTHLSWSRRGVPFRAILVAAVLRRRAADLRVIIHDPTPFAGPGALGWLRARAQEATMVVLALLAGRAFLTVDPDVVGWARLPFVRRRLSTLPVGSNIEPVAQRSFRGNVFTIAVFSVTEGPKLSEVDELAAIVNEVGAALGSVQVLVFGRGALAAEPALRSRLGPNVICKVDDVLPEATVSQRLADSDALLFIRGTVSTRRGTVTAALAHGLPVVGYSGRETGAPVTDAGVVLVDSGDIHGAANELIGLARDDERCMHFASRSQATFNRCLSWPAIAEVLGQG